MTDSPVRQSLTHSEHFKAISRTVGALSVLLPCPLWPIREELSPSGQALYDSILEQCKPYALMVADEDHAGVFRTLAQWSRLCSAFQEQTLINDPDNRKREANRKMLAVSTYFADQAGVEWSKLQ